jgi:predicted metal-dependent HD superfamily phosphohydrolase
VLESERAVRSAWRALGGDDESITPVIERHGEPPRRYHTIDHVASVLRCIDEIVDEEPVGRVDVVRAAAIFHDAVYDPRAADNEARSADLAVEVTGAALGWGEDDTDVLRRLVLATADHEPSDRLEAVLLDADLAIIGAPPAAYASYVEGVRGEYAHVDDAGWRAGRGQVLQMFLDREAIFATEAMRRRREVQARVNLRAELESLR